MATPHRPDLVITDVRMPPSGTDDGLRAALDIRARRPGTPVLVLSQYVLERSALELIAGGAEGVGYLLKDRVADIERSGDEKPPPRTRQVIEDWLYGEHFHWDADKAKRLSEYEPPELLLFSFLSAVMQASTAYDALAEVGVAALEL